MRPELRKVSRRLVRHGARLLSADGTDLGPCFMLDLSATGARLKVRAAEQLPNDLYLLLSHDGQLRRQCSVVWRSGGTIGVEFIPTYPLAAKRGRGH